MNRIITLMGASTLLVLFASLMLDNAGIELGQKAPLADKKLQAVDGSSYSLHDLKKENGLLVIFSCNTCPWVVGSENFPGWEVQYNDLHKMASEKNMGMVLLNSNEAKREGDDSMKEMKERASEKAYSMNYLEDSNSELANAFGAKTTPHVYLFNAKLELVYMGSIDNTWDSKRKKDVHYLKDAIQNLNQAKKIKKPSTPPRGCSIKRL